MITVPHGLSVGAWISWARLGAAAILAAAFGAALRAGEPAEASPNGLRGEYFKGTDVNNPKNRVLERIDSAVDFNWGNGSPGPGMPSDNFSVRWTGLLLPKKTGKHVFLTNSDDGVRVWINGKALIDNWTDHPPTMNRGEIVLEAGKTYTVRIEFYERGGGALMQFFWESPGEKQEIVPTERLTPASSAAAPIAPVSTKDQADDPHNNW